MREIKFRAWDNKREKMLINTNLVYPALSLSGGITAYENDKKIPDTVAEKRFELMQFTGLKDENGKEIYEGDIIKYKYSILSGVDEVVFINGCFELKNDTINYSKRKVGNVKDFGEVVGNIYENKDLLSGK